MIILTLIVFGFIIGWILFGLAMFYVCHLLLLWAEPNERRARKDLTIGDVFAAKDEHEEIFFLFALFWPIMTIAMVTTALWTKYSDWYNNSSLGNKYDTWYEAKKKAFFGITIKKAVKK